jgi:dihydrofolate synthase/folylpolyglutamate synthase
LIDTVAAAAASLPEQLQPTGFELMTVAGILAARESGADALVCEVGLGGRLDSTNVLDLGVAAVTSVGLDHQEHLGNTVTAIAIEKAQIIKAGDAAVTGAVPPALDVVRARCADVGAALHVVRPEDVHTTVLGRDGIRVTTQFGDRPLTVHATLLGEFQGMNVGVAVAVLDQLRLRFGFPIDEDAVRTGCESTRWRGRMQWIDATPALLVDGAHNPDGMRALVETLAALREQRRVVAVFAAMRDKDVAAMASTLRSAHPDAVVVTAPEVERAADPAQLARLFESASAIVPVAAALDRARAAAGEDGLVVVCGSLFLAGEALTLLGA